MSKSGIALWGFVCCVVLASPLSAEVATAECPESKVEPALEHAGEIIEGDDVSDEKRAAAVDCLQRVLREGEEEASAERAGELLADLYDRLGDEQRVELAAWLRHRADALDGRFPATVGGRLAGRYAELEGARSEREMLLGRREANTLYEAVGSQLFDSAIVETWKDQAEDDDAKAPVAAVLPIKNETRRAVGGALSALSSKLETDLVNKSAADVVNLDNQPALLDELRAQQSDEFAPSELGSVGKQVGADYLVTGTMYALERPDVETPTVEYVFVAQVIETGTGHIVFQTEERVEKSYDGG